MPQPRPRVPEMKAEEATELPDDEPISKLVPSRMVTKTNKEIGHKREKKAAEDKTR